MDPHILRLHINTANVVTDFGGANNSFVMPVTEGGQRFVESIEFVEAELTRDAGTEAFLRVRLNNREQVGNLETFPERRRFLARLRLPSAGVNFVVSDANSVLGRDAVYFSKPESLNFLRIDVTDRDGVLYNAPGDMTAWDLTLAFRLYTPNPYQSANPQYA